MDSSSAILEENERLRQEIERLRDLTNRGKKPKRYFDWALPLAPRQQYFLYMLYKAYPDSFGNPSDPRQSSHMMHVRRKLKAFDSRMKIITAPIYGYRIDEKTHTLLEPLVLPEPR